jgi:hypothetical protein
MFAVPVEVRSEETLREVIETHVHHGSKILTDCWRGYGFLRNNENYEWGTVNHSETFRDPLTGIHTNTIEGTNSMMKAKIPKRCRTRNAIGNHLGVIVWRRQNEHRLWEALVEALADYVWLE